MWNQIKISKLDDKLVKGLRNSKMWEWNEMLVQINFMITLPQLEFVMVLNVYIIIKNIKIMYLLHFRMNLISSFKYMNCINHGDNFINPTLSWRQVNCC